MNLIITGFLLLSLSATAHKHKQQRHHHAHNHGDAQLTLAFDKLKGQLEFKGAADGVVGFEHEAKSETDKKKLATVTAEFEANISHYVQLDAASECTFTKKNIDMIKETGGGTHADFVARFDVTCAKPIQNTMLNFDFTSLKRLKKIEATILVNELQLKTEIKGEKTTLEIK